MDYQTYKLAQNFTFEARSPLRKYDLSDEQNNRIEETWEKLLEEKKLFNGYMFCFSSLTPETLTGEFTEYKYYAVQTADSNLKEVLKIEPVCVSGLTFSDYGVLVGKRTVNVNEYQGFYEFVPSGGIEPSQEAGRGVDVLGQLKGELEQEAGLQQGMVKSISPFAIVHDKNNGRYEVCAEIYLNSDSPLHLNPTKEYEHLSWVPMHSIYRFLKENREKVVPFSYFLWCWYQEFA